MLFIVTFVIEKGRVNLIPYINQQARLEIAGGKLPQTPGELNYVISTELWKWCIDRSYVTDLEATMIAYVESRPINYTNLNEVMGVLEYVYCEFRRRRQTKPHIFHVAVRIKELQDLLCAKFSNDYEDEKLRLNGDVFL